MRGIGLDLAAQPATTAVVIVTLNADTAIVDEVGRVMETTVTAARLGAREHG